MSKFKTGPDARRGKYPWGGKRPGARRAHLTNRIKRLDAGLEEKLEKLRDKERILREQYHAEYADARAGLQEVDEYLRNRTDRRRKPLTVDRAVNKNLLPFLGSKTRAQIEAAIAKLESGRTTPEPVAVRRRGRPPKNAAGKPATGKAATEPDLRVLASGPADAIGSATKATAALSGPASEAADPAATKVTRASQGRDVDRPANYKSAIPEPPPPEPEGTMSPRDHLAARAKMNRERGATDTPGAMVRAYFAANKVAPDWKPEVDPFAFDPKDLPEDGDGNWIRPDGYIIDIEGYILNPKGQRVRGVPPGDEDLGSDGWLRWVQPEDRPQPVSAAAQSARAKERQRQREAKTLPAVVAIDEVEDKLTAYLATLDRDAPEPMKSHRKAFIAEMEALDHVRETYTAAFVAGAPLSDPPDLSGFDLDKVLARVPPAGEPA